MLEQVAIIGLGLIGGSVALGLRQQGVRVSAFDQDTNSLNKGLELGVIDVAAGSIADAVKDAQLVLMAVPVLAMPDVISAIKIAETRAVLTDVGSVKAPVLEAVTEAYGSCPSNFVPGHPIAGSEQHGVQAANPTLFEKHRVLLTPNSDTDENAIALVRSMWQSLGAEVSLLSIPHHDNVLAQTSHLPHLLAYSLIDTLSAQGDSLEIFEYAAGGLRDFSRIAASDPVMWRDIFMSNRAPLLAILDQFCDELAELRSDIETGNEAELLKRLARSKSARDHFSSILAERQQSTSASSHTNASSQIGARSQTKASGKLEEGSEHGE